MSATRNRIAAIRAQVIEMIQRGQQPFDHACVHCIESQAALQLDHVRAAYVAELSRDDCPRHRIQSIRRELREIDAKAELLLRPSVSELVH